MSDRPIIFSAPMVRALLDGKKTQTRRVLARDPIACAGPETGFASIDVPRTPRWRKGDRLWVREAWGINDYHHGGTNPIPKSRPSDLADDHLVYFATEDDAEILNEMPRRPSIHMPRWASRITLLVTDVRVQRLQDISEEDAVAEGITPFRHSGSYVSPKWADGKYRAGDDAYTMFRDLWNSLHGADAWEKNPWVAALTFTVERRNIDEVPRA